MKLIVTENYITTIKNSIGSKLFKNLYAEVDGKKIDIVNDGKLSCALFVSSILYLFKLMKEVHATVNGTLKDLQDSGWIEINEPKEGVVLIWAEADFDGAGFHRHIGFYTGGEIAISNDYKTGMPKEHNFKFNGERKIEKILWNTKLN